MNKRKFFKTLGNTPPAIWIIAVMLVFFGSNTKNYFAIKNFTNIAIQAAPLFVVACGQTIIVLMQGTDLSIGASLNMVTVLWIVLMQMGLPMGVALTIAMSSAVAAGFLNGVIVTKLKLPPFIATLGMQNILNSIALILANGSSVYYKHSIFKVVAKQAVLGLPIIIWVAVGCFLLTWVLLKRTRFVCVLLLWEVTLKRLRLLVTAIS